jgi:hypothetical protein
MDIMLDIETIGTSPRAVILSVAMVEFQIQADGHVEIGAEKLWVPDLRRQLALGREVDPKTMKFWLDADDSARLHWTHPTSICSFEEMLQGITDFWRLAPREGLWANGIIFDVGILEDAYKQVGSVQPWPYNAPRDARTIYRVLEQKRSLPTQDFVLHDPVADCIAQIWKLAERIPT